MQNQRTPSTGRFLGIFLIFGIVFLARPGEAEQIMLRVTHADATLRLEAAATSPQVAKVPLGSILTAERKSGEWYRVNLPPDDSGFIISGFIHQDDVVIVDKGAVAPPPEISQAESRKTVELVVTVQNADIREGPDEQSRLMGQAPRGTELLSEEKQGGWYKVSVTANIFGYIRQNQVELIAPLKSRELAPEQPPEKKEQAQRSELSSRPQETVKSRRFSLRLTLGAGVGFESIDTGAYKVINDKSTPITLHPGGGGNFGVDFGYLITRNLKLELGLGYQNSGVIAGGEQVTFSRMPINLTVSYGLPSQRSYHIYLGAGASLYAAPEVKYDVDNVKIDISYDSSFGAHGLVGVIKKAKSGKWFFFGELKYVGVFNYKWKTATINGLQTILYSSSPYAEFGANGIFLNFGIGWFF
jgi:outer membrane protein W/uncharacterized protein YgiM (DUF1202 family)